MHVHCTTLHSGGEQSLWKFSYHFEQSSLAQTVRRTHTWWSVHSPSPDPDPRVTNGAVAQRTRSLHGNLHKPCLVQRRVQILLHGRQGRSRERLVYTKVAKKTSHSKARALIASHIIRALIHKDMCMYVCVCVCVCVCVYVCVCVCMCVCV